MLTQRERENKDGSGFTLIELVVAIAILGIIMTALVAIILTSLAVGRETEARLDSSNALRRVTPLFADDVASSTEVVRNTTAKCGGGTALFEMRGRTFDEPAPVTPPQEPAAFSTAVAYVLGPGGALERRTCRSSAPSDGSTPSMSPVSTTELAAALDAATATCSPNCTSPDALYTLTLTPVGADPQSLSASRRTS